MIGPLPTQLWGVIAIAIGALVALGLIPSGRPAALALFIILGPGAIALGIATFLTRFFRDPTNSDAEQPAGSGKPMG